ncbi:MAG: hypothetical protein CMM58_10070 [Rhodospirillaceae bacterium]|nr:hypothetical protein [Rhodospirillaceae bacterium]
MSSIIYLIRHGETTWNRIGRLQGQADSPLTLLGTRQTEAVGRALQKLVKNQQYRFWCSPLGRTRQTASIICDVLNFDYNDVIFDDRLKEITLGERDGYANWQALLDDFPEEMSIRADDPWNFAHPDGESSQMVQDRLKPLLDQILEMSGAHIIVAHGVVSKIIRGIYLDLSSNEIFALTRPQNAFHVLSNGSVKMIGTNLK